jgi:nicotinamidase-related amidase
MSIQNTRDSLDKGQSKADSTRILRAAASDSLLLVIDMQTRLLPAISNAQNVHARVDRLIRAARLLDIPVQVTEHCAEAIGPTDSRLRAHLTEAEVLKKRSFDAAADPAVTRRLEALDRRSIAICGVEAHVCVAQTALGLRARGYEVFVLEDACGSRHEGDRRVVLARLVQAGCVPMTVEAMVFEWLGHADHPRFRDLLAIIKEA